MSRKKIIYSTALCAALFNLIFFPSNFGTLSSRHVITQPWLNIERPDFFRFAAWLAIIGIMTAIARMLFGRDSKLARARIVDAEALPINR